MRKQFDSEEFRRRLEEIREQFDSEEFREQMRQAGEEARKASEEFRKQMEKMRIDQTNAILTPAMSGDRMLDILEKLEEE